MNKILIDATSLSDQYKSRGLGTYARELIWRLIKDRGMEWHLIGFDDIKDDPKLSSATFHSIGSVVSSTPKNVIQFRKAFLPIIREVQPALYYAPHFERGLPIGTCNTVVMMHDVSPYIHNAYSTKGPGVNFLKGLFYKYNLNRAKKADAILSNSHFTKSELVKVGFDEHKVSVTHLGQGQDLSIGRNISEAQISKVKEKYGIEKPFVLYYGGLEPNKNIPELLKAFSKANSDRSIQLVLSDKKLSREGANIVADSSDAAIAKQLIEKYDLERDIVLPTFIETNDLAILFHEALCFVHLSNHEGFGFSVVEALSTGCPVIAADRSCYPEIIGDAALLVDPDNVQEIVTAIKTMTSDDTIRNEYKQKGPIQAARYSWDRTAQETLEVFRRVMNGK